jgi:predicted nucleic acid-binding protein
VFAVDTSVLLRRLLNDDVAQAEKARRLFETDESLLVTDVVLRSASLRTRRDVPATKARLDFEVF